MPQDTLQENAPRADQKNTPGIGQRGALESRVDAVDQWLPQTQCTQCSYPRCRDYAQAVVNGDADINQCPPGGDITIQGLAHLLGTPAKPLDTSFGQHRPKQIAVIDEDRCIGCVMCIKACPTDAIIGMAKRMHTVIEKDCTGCELCLEPCPVDCIDMIDQQLDQPAQLNWQWPDYSPEDATRARVNTEAKLAREATRLQQRSSLKKLRSLQNDSGTEQIKVVIAAAVARVKSKQTSDNE